MKSVKVTLAGKSRRVWKKHPRLQSRVAKLLSEGGEKLDWTGAFKAACQGSVESIQAEDGPEPSPGRPGLPTLERSSR